jgi:hypothetical protein
VIVFRQYLLQADDKAALRCWLDTDAKLRIGQRLTLADDDREGRLWTVEGVGDIEVRDRPNRSWRVGGLA